MNAYEAPDPDNCDPEADTKAARDHELIESSRKKLESWNKWGRWIRGFGIVMAIAFLGALGFVWSTLSKMIQPSLAAVGLGLGFIVGFKLAIYTYQSLQVMTAPAQDQLLVEYHDKLRDAGLI